MPTINFGHSVSWYTYRCAQYPNEANLSVYTFLGGVQPPTHPPIFTYARLSIRSCVYFAVMFFFFSFSKRILQVGRLSSIIRTTKLSYTFNFSWIPSFVLSCYISLVLEPIWLYGTQLWGAAIKSNTYNIQTFQPTSLTNVIARAPPPCVSNHARRSDLKILSVQEQAENAYGLFGARLTNHSDPLIRALNSRSPSGKSA